LVGPDLSPRLLIRKLKAEINGWGGKSEAEHVTTSRRSSLQQSLSTPRRLVVWGQWEAPCSCGNFSCACARCEAWTLTVRFIHGDML